MEITDDLIRAVILVILAISSLGCGFIYCYFQELRRRFAFRLVFWISLMDLGLALGYFTPDTPERQCKAEGYVTSYFSLAAVLRTATLAYFLYHPVNQSEWQLEAWFSLFVNGIPFCLLAVPKEQFMQSEGWCWIRIDNGNLCTGTILRLIIFYVPLWLVIAYDLITYRHISRRIQQEEQHSQLPLANANML